MIDSVNEKLILSSRSILCSAVLASLSSNYVALLYGV